MAPLSQRLRAVAATFYRGGASAARPRPCAVSSLPPLLTPLSPLHRCSLRKGTSRGLIFSPAALARFDAPTRDRIICTASASPLLPSSDACC